MSLKTKKRKPSEKETKKWRKKMRKELVRTEDISMMFFWDRETGTPQQVLKEIKTKFSEICKQIKEAQKVAKTGLVLFPTNKRTNKRDRNKEDEKEKEKEKENKKKKKKKKEKQRQKEKEEEEENQDACFICHETEPEHLNDPPHGITPCCDQRICNSCWWSYHTGDAMCVFCDSETRPEECECPEVEACECLTRAQSGERGHYPL